MKITTFKIINLAVIASMINACHSSEKKQPETKDPVCITDTLAKIIQIDTAKIARIDDELTLSGEISFDQNKVVKVFPFSSGQVVDVKVSLGDKVSKGQVLAIIRSADVAGNYSDLVSASSDVAIAKRNLDNIASLFKSGISSEKEYNEAKQNYEKALAAQRKVRELININGGGNTNAGGQYIIRSPINGYIVEKKINAGNFIRIDNPDNLFTISDLKKVWVLANVFEADIARVKEGYTAKVKTLAYPDKIFVGKVDKVAEVLDPDNKVMKIRITLPNDKLELKPEMFTNVIITNKEARETVALPTSAIVFENGKYYVVIYKGRCDLSVREVQLLKTLDNITYIANGIQPGEQVISRNQILLYNALTQN